LATESGLKSENRVMSRNRASKRESATEQKPALSKVELFQGLPETFLRKLEEKSEAQEVGKDFVFFGPGESGHSLFLLERGRVETYRNSGKKKLIISELEPPAVFGEMGCVGQCVYHCSARATEPSRVRAIRQPDVEALLDKFPSVTRKLLDLVSVRFVNVLLDLDATSFKHLIPRLAKLLLQKAREDCVENMTHREIAEHLRVYRESATAALGELRKAGIVAVERKRIRILDSARLERAARE
jgi:CRP/FNR family transcriptional regulator, cyclic AMP receptor protein